MKKIFFLIALIVGLNALNAQDLNGYKYIIVPKTFGINVKAYQLTSLTTKLFQKEGFITIIKGSKMPTELKKNPCFGLHADVDKVSEDSANKLISTLKNCHGKVVFESGQEGLIKRENKSAYQDALVNAFEPIKRLNYSFSNVKMKSQAKSIKVHKHQQRKLSNNNTEKKGVAVPDHFHNPNDKAEEVGIATPDHWHNVNAKTAGKGLDVPDFMKNPTSKTKVIKAPTQLRFKNISYKLKQSKNGFNLYKNGSSKTFARLVPSENEGYYRYINADHEGIAHFDFKGNLVVKYLISDTDKIQEIRFQTH
ncbi:hypothetical protein [Gelidibacter maritimus]|uniref:Uncharacterized protein n=1 Tax=Gelidibacter maritimus TaxID=2761487 RepID=A0A7W2M3I2_9FLAO|nr:hypothetical protein [Gelidibacter maritimus]MBA6152017.1 hypothetical protein [Gelidibacter maritimus]